MSKIFLSHSTFDKEFVDQVFEMLGAGRCVYDKVTFKKNSDLALQIRDGLEGCEFYALFLSSAALKSNWVRAEIDLANELKTQWKVKKVFIFQLDSTSWTELPSWMGRYVVACPPSPAHVALRLMDELRPSEEEDANCLGRSDDEQRIIFELSEADASPSFIYLSGPVGIGRRTLASSIYKTFYKEISQHKLHIRLESFDGYVDIYRKALTYSANWRAGDYRRAVDSYSEKPEMEQIKDLADLLKSITTVFRQVIIIDLGVAALTEEGKPQKWFVDLARKLTPADYPYIWFLSQRFLGGFEISNGLFYAVQPLESSWSSTLFTVLLKKYKISLPSKDEQKGIESSISGHPGLINFVANYLRKNPAYKPTRTHNNIVKLINEQVQAILIDFIGENKEKEKAVAFYAESHILSYEEIVFISRSWPEFEASTESLLDTGLLVRQGSDYSLASYVGRVASSFAAKHHDNLRDYRRILLTAFDSISEDSYISTQLLDARIVEHILDGSPIGSYLTNLVMPSQQIKAAKRNYDARRYEASLSLAKLAYDQNGKLSKNGRREAWRLIGLSAIRGNSLDDFLFFSREYERLEKTPQVNSHYYFANGLKARTEGNLRLALKWYEKIEQEKYADSHVYRELAYVYAFERSFDKALSCVRKAHNLAIGNPYILDILGMILIDRYRSERATLLAGDIEVCLDDLKKADEREGTSFYYARSKIRDVVIHNDVSSLSELFANRRLLPISAKTSLLGMLSAKGKNHQYDELHQEIKNVIRNERNPLVQLEIARIDFEHEIDRGNYSAAESILDNFRVFLTDRCVQNMERQLPCKKRN